MTLLTMVQQAALMVGITQPSVVVGSTNQQVQELLACAQEEGRKLMKRGVWQVLRKQQLFSAVAQEIQTNMIPSDYDRFVNETFWNRTRRRPLYGPMTPQEWQNLKAWTSSPVSDTFTMRGNDIYIIPTPTAGDEMAYEYVSKNWCQSSGGTPQDEWLADTDTGILPERIMQMGIQWRYKQKKGLKFMPDYQVYETEVKQQLAGDNPLRTVNFGNPNWIGRYPGIAVPDGSWSVPN